MLGKLEKSKFSKAFTMQTSAANLEIDGSLKAVPKEDQLKLLTEILRKIETLETKVKHQVNQQKQMLGIAGANLNRDN